MLTLTSCWGSLAISSSIASSEPGHVGLDDERELLDGALLGELEDVFEGHLAARATRQRLGLQAVGPFAGELAGAALVLDHPHQLAGLGHAVEAEHLDRLAGHRALELAAHEVVHRPYPAEVGAGDERVAHPQRAALDQDRHHRPAAGVELGLDHGPGGLRLLVGLQLLEVGDHLDRVQQRVEADSWSWR